jgi:hypothetical protein
MKQMKTVWEFSDNPGVRFKVDDDIYHWNEHGVLASEDGGELSVSKALLDQEVAEYKHVCIACGGSGQIGNHECVSCRGTGISRTCLKCGGREGREYNNAAGGSGWQKCEVCDGTGLLSLVPWWAIPSKFEEHNKV